MNNLNVTTIHDNSKSQINIGLDTKKFQIKNSGSTIEIVDKANSVTSLKVGGSSGFTITYTGGKIVFSANSGSSPLAIREPGRGGIEGCPFYYCHQDKYSGGYSSYNLRSNHTETINVSELSDNNTVEIVDESKLPDAKELDDGTIMMVVSGHWVEYSFDDLYNMIIDKMNTEYLLNKI